MDYSLTLYIRQVLRTCTPMFPWHMGLSVHDITISSATFCRAHHSDQQTDRQTDRHAMLCVNVQQ